MDGVYYCFSAPWCAHPELKGLEKWFALGLEVLAADFGDQTPGNLSCYNGADTSVLLFDGKEFCSCQPWCQGCGCFARQEEVYRRGQPKERSLCRGGVGARDACLQV